MPRPAFTITLVPETALCLVSQLLQYPDNSGKNPAKHRKIIQSMTWPTVTRMSHVHHQKMVLLPAGWLVTHNICETLTLCLFWYSLRSFPSCINMAPSSTKNPVQTGRKHWISRQKKSKASIQWGLMNQEVVAKTRAWCRGRWQSN